MRSASACSLVAVVLFAGACAQIPLHANMTDAAYRARLDEYFHAGMTRAEVEAKLDELNVGRKTRMWYGGEEGGAPPQLLVRVYEAGGFWLNEDDQIVEWVDTVCVFGRESPEPLLDRVETFRRHQRYVDGEPVNFPTEPTKYRWNNYPMPPPPPSRPLVGE